MDAREKLIEILKQAPFEGKVLDEWWWEEKIKRIADHLIGNGVTVQEWISVEDRLPEMGEHYQSEDVLVCIDYRPDDPDTTKDSYVSIDHVDFNCFGQGWFSCERDDPRDGEPSPYFVTHWMPMPLVESTGLICHSRRKENDNETD